MFVSVVCVCVCVKACLTKKGGKTKHDAKYFIDATEFEFDGNLSVNQFEMPKSVKAKDIAKESEKALNAFLNTDGGVLYFGIDKTWIVKGVEVKNSEIKAIETEIVAVVNTFTPKLKNSDLKKLKISTVAILTNDGSVKENNVVIKVTVPGPIKGANGENIIHKTSKGDKFKKNLNYIMKCY